MTILPRTLAAMQFRPTSYEVVAKTATEEVRLAFTERRTKSSLLVLAQYNGDQILKLLGDWNGEATYNKREGWTFGPVRICFSGRTERELATH